MLYFLFKGGPVMVPLVLVSIFGLAIILERLFSIRKVYKLNMNKFAENIYGMVAADKIKEALEACRKENPYPLPSLFVIALENRNSNRQHVEKMLERAGNHYVKNLEKRLGGLVSLVGIAPLLGFLGTITGLIRAFMAWEKMGNDITVSALASGIYEAMITTAVGLMIAIPYFLFYNYFISRIKYFSHELNDYAGRLLEMILKD